MKTRLTLLLMVALSSVSASAAYLRDDGLSQWPVSPSGPLFIDVCFESLSEPTSGTPPVPMATLRGWIADGVRSTWGHHARIVFRFDMTTACGPNSTSYIRIGWSDTNPSVAVVGAELRGIPHGMVLARWMTSEQVTDCPGGQYELCTKNDAIHEFGHALGFFHEEEHPDRTFSSVGELEGRECDTRTVTGGRRIGAYDLNSVMSPCGRAFKAFPWSAANRWSTDSGSAAPNSGAAVQIWDCSPVLGLQWHMRTRLKNVDDGRCLDANGGDQLQVPNGQTCGSGLLNIQQLWDYYPGHLSNW